MASKNRPTSDAIALQQAILAHPYKFGFYQTLRRFESIYNTKPRIGTSVRPADDIVRLIQEPSLIFAPATIAAFTSGDAGKLPELSVTFFGMFGPNGPLPLHLTEYARDRIRNSDDPTFSEFLNIFHHRMLSLFYRSWANAQPTVNFDRPQQDRFSVYIGSLFGLGMPSLRNRDNIPDFAKLHFAGRLSAHSHNAEGLVAMIQSFFEVPVVIEQFVGEWLELPVDCRFQLGVSPQTSTLGVSATIGEFVWQCQQKFRIILGPLDKKDYRRFLPGYESEKRLRSMVRNYVGDSMNWDLNLVLKKGNAPSIKLGLDDNLGWNTWLGKITDENDISDLILEPMKATA